MTGLTTVLALFLSLLVSVNVSEADAKAKATPTTACNFDVTAQEGDYLEVCGGRVCAGIFCGGWPQRAMRYSIIGWPTCTSGYYGTWVGFATYGPVEQRCEPVEGAVVQSLPGLQTAFVFNDGPNPVRFIGTVTD